MSAVVVTPSEARLANQTLTRSYTELMRQVRSEQLLDRARGFYAIVFATLMLAMGGTITGFVLLGHSWLQLLMAGAFGVIFTQLAFLGHEASHRQIFKTNKANDQVGRLLATLMVGISYSWWMNKHNRHHGNPNKIGKDPDLEIDTISFIEQDAATRTGFLGWLTRRQGYLFFPLLTLEGINLHLTSITSLFRRDHKVEGRWLELTMLAIRLGGFITVLFLVLPIGMAFAFLGVQLAVFGVYMGASFAPNHKGMPVIGPDEKLDFFTKQVRTSRNVSGGWWATTLLGGLNYQIEHHLFPSMPRTALARARTLVMDHCRTHDVPYTETTLLRSYGIVIRYLNRVGLAARDPFDCPAAARFRGL